MSHKVVQPTELLDGISANQLRREITDVMAEGVKTILVDLQDVTFMNSSAIGALVATLKAVRAGGGEMFLCSLNDQVRIIFELTKMDQIFKICADRQEFEQKFAVTAN
ncbi:MULTISPECIES: STAS domain-containing protein [Acaryochloris]|uniref:STAS domain-containing protein n=1 Tax=Acaryochloris TaxID=155977 RepID=UPI0002483BB5|nr:MULTISPECIES: STAS domain-containing protein [Acaryochloris]KAI9133508.1 STAS domain-containing protein [Acaryochloris sp. CCMEE 5410]QUY43663.1 STAS domain-containing protein [Acaryochloris marina S15]UJB68455.1 STAS domain-containing protein [Acaryochloris sp. 'Moss Beach']